MVENNLYPNIEPFVKKIDQLILIQTNEADNLKLLVEKIFVKVIVVAVLAILMGILIIVLLKYKSRLEELLSNQTKELSEAYDELRCANEELQAGNEELDAANQEYSTINEQLTIVNNELQNHKNNLELIVAERVKDLIESEARYRTLVDNIMHPFIVTTFEGQLLYTNQLGADFLGILLKDTANYNFTNSFWVDISNRQKYVDQLRADGFIKNKEVEAYNNLGEIATIILSSTTINYHGIQAIFSVFNDITERKRMENALFEAELKLNAVFESTNDFIWAVDAETFKIIAFNSAMRDEFERSIHKTIQIGTTIEEIVSENWGQPVLDMYRRVLKEGRLEKEISMTSANKILHLTFNLLKRGEENFGISVFGKDITEKKKAELELKKSEETFRVTFEQAGIGIAMVNTEGRPFKSNPKLQEMLGYNQEELSTMQFTEFTHPEDVSKDWNLYSDLLKRNIQYYQIEKRFIRKDGEIVWVNLVASMVWSPEGLPLYGIGMVEDMTEKKEMERQILTNVIKTEENERLHFSQELHDGLGPLISAIKMYIQLIGMPNSKMQLSDIIMNVEKLIDEASNSIREISFKLSPHILMNFGIVEALKAFIEKVKETNRIIVNLQNENICRLPETIEIIIYRVICECINNTLKYAKAKKIDLSISCQNDELEVVYHDNGIGFNVGKTSGEYKGIGLMSMQSRIRSINGDIRIESNKEQGTNISIKIKLTDHL